LGSYCIEMVVVVDVDDDDDDDDNFSAFRFYQVWR
jgi:hypothetical protein